jgi:hypothetical protein
MKKLSELQRKTAPEPVDQGVMDAEMKQALGDFKASVIAWSDAAQSRPRAVLQTTAHFGWRLATTWAMGAVLLVGGISSGAYMHHRAAVERQIALEQQKEEQQKLLAAQRAMQEERLLANVDQDVSRQVPEALEPLAQLMSDDGAQ